MAQSIETHCLTKKQIETVLTNFCNIHHLVNRTLIYHGKPVFSKANEEKYNLVHITKFANDYMLYEATFESPSPFAGHKMYMIIVESTKFDKLHINACSWFYHLFEHNINPNGIDGHPQVYLMPAFVITETMMKRVSSNVLPCLYRFVSLTDMYPMIGSSNGLYGMTFDYEIIPDEELYNGRVYPVIFDSDVIVKILNAKVGDLIRCRRVMFEGSPYGEYYIRRVAVTVYHSESAMDADTNGGLSQMVVTTADE